MNALNKILFGLRNRFNTYVYKNKKFKTEDEFYTYLFTKNPSWNSPEPNEDELIRWAEIKAAIESCNLSGKDLKILEIGCGRGWLCKKLTTYGNVIGIEPVKSVVEYAKKLFPQLEFYGETPSSFLQKSPEKKFDLIVTTEVIEHIKNKNKFIEEIYELLHQDGCLVLTTPRLEYYKESVEALGGDPNQPVEEWVSETQLTEMLVSNKFKILHKKFFSPLPNLNRKVFITQLFAATKIA